jgi:hypothetical protein
VVYSKSKKKVKNRKTKQGRGSFGNAGSRLTYHVFVMIVAPFGPAVTRERRDVSGQGGVTLVNEAIRQTFGNKEAFVDAILTRRMRETFLKNNDDLASVETTDQKISKHELGAARTEV